MGAQQIKKAQTFPEFGLNSKFYIFEKVLNLFQVYNSSCNYLICNTSRARFRNSFVIILFEVIIWQDKFKNNLKTNQKQFNQYIIIIFIYEVGRN